MIPRDCVASGEAEAVFRRTGEDYAPAQPHKVPGMRLDQVPAWEELYRAISPEQQRELLALAERQGVVYAHQLPVLANGASTDANRKVLGRLLSGAVAELSPLHPESVEVGDHELDAVQREAVAKALATPDIVLVQGRPGTGKSCVAAEIIVRATARGERVLLLAPTTAAIDRVLELAVAHDAVFPVRCLEPDEDVTRLPLAIRALTFQERARSLNFHARECARRQVEADEQRVRRLEQDRPVWVQLDELARQREVLDGECQALEQRRAHLASEVAEEADALEAAPSRAGDGFGLLLLDLTSAHREAGVQAEARLAELHGRVQAREQELAHRDRALDALRPSFEARQQGRWWTWSWWWAAVRAKSIRKRWAQLQEDRRQVQTDLDTARAQTASAARQWEEAKEAFAAKRTGLITAEVERRRADLDDREAVLRREQSVLQQKWQHACQALAAESPRPAAMTVQASQAAHARWCQLLEQAQAQHVLTRQWAAYLEQTPDVLTARLPGYANLVAATLTALARDEYFGRGRSGTSAPLHFDLLVLEEADQISESDFVQAAQRARRWILLGEPAGHADSLSAPRQQSPAAHEAKGASSAPPSRAPASPRPGVFQRLWQQLHCDPRQLPYAWVQEANRLCCRLRPVTAEQRQWITAEHVADFPEIELRILTAPRCQPVLAEIVFPPSFSIDRAKQYIFQELEEVAVQATGSSLRWLDERDRVVLRLADRDLAHGLAIDLVPGVREILGTAALEGNGSRKSAAGWQTCCLEFDRLAGWDRRRAADWLRDKLGLRDLGRTIALEACYRSESVTFVPVPALQQAAPARKGVVAGQRGVDKARAEPRVSAPSRKGGAGLELDLSDHRHRDRLPAELRPHLPKEGFVNYLEAQAVVQTLAALVEEMGLRDPRGEVGSGSRRPTIAVLALYPAQAELIRRLMQEHPSLADLDNMVEVTVPAAFRQREAAVVLLSLTRSHTHRAVAFGSGPRLLALAMTRARSRLIIFGDPGTLMRRSQWDGPLEHLDEHAAAYERQLISGLVHYLPGGDSSLGTVPSRQGSGT